MKISEKLNTKLPFLNVNIKSSNAVLEKNFLRILSSDTVPDT